jgi:hypothetical protein
MGLETEVPKAASADLRIIAAAFFVKLVSG